MGEISIAVLDNNYIAKRFEILDGLLSGRTACNAMINLLSNFITFMNLHQIMMQVIY